MEGHGAATLSTALNSNAFNITIGLLSATTSSDPAAMAASCRRARCGRIAASSSGFLLGHR
jgi:hypothetical protein